MAPALIFSRRRDAQGEVSKVNFGCPGKFRVPKVNFVVPGANCGFPKVNLYAGKYLISFPGTSMILLGCSMLLESVGCCYRIFDFARILGFPEVPGCSGEVNFGIPQMKIPRPAKVRRRLTFEVGSIWASWLFWAKLCIVLIRIKPQTDLFWLQIDFLSFVLTCTASYCLEVGLRHAFAGLGRDPGGEFSRLPGGRRWDPGGKLRGSREQLPFAWSSKRKWCISSHFTVYHTCGVVLLLIVIASVTSMIYCYCVIVIVCGLCHICYCVIVIGIRSRSRSTLTSVALRIPG